MAASPSPPADVSGLNSLLWHPRSCDDASAACLMELEVDDDTGMNADNDDVMAAEEDADRHKAHEEEEDSD
eukprot:CAMPEP_0201919446 /NCGR_PEP_ID=MMETSP0903-20130614/8347_1 /ASSEMBLY_ACC=CAM_ASM_000552 /TAXON_ID=420261 /ORGANISM="Thalassiosira antarctica, Strain CCMP982" /LENGTH=70 /DNA_ID=CAMNT_0048455983 /DNA_START=110 /DNA_END=323 /DNA_ORIENTATION=-